MGYVIDPDLFLSLHIFLELSSVIMSFAIFVITFYTFEQSNNLKSLIISCTFFIVGILDIFHLLSYKGMPAFLVESSPAQATAFWVLARLTMAIGLLFTSIISPYQQTKLKRYIFLLFSLCYVAAWVVIVTYYNDCLPRLYIEGKGLTALKIILEYIIIVIQTITVIIFVNNFSKRKNDKKYLAYIISGLIVSIAGEFVFTLYVNVYDIYNMLAHMFKIISYYLLFHALFVRNIEKPYQQLSMAEKQISVYANNLEKMVEQRTSEIERAKAKLDQDIDYAKNIQLALLPTTFPSIKGMDFAAKYLPCDKLGGDFYNIFKLDDDNIGILIGDVAGHGVSAAMVNVFINQNIHVKKQYDDGRNKIFTPRGVLMNLYHVYNEMPFPEEVYLVMLYGIYNTKKHTFTYSSAGMNASPLILGRDGNVRFIQTKGFPICKFGKFFKPSYETKIIKLNSNDTIIFYTDGLVDIDRTDPDLFANKNLLEFIKGIRNMSSKEICDQIVDAYFTLLNGRKMLDDLTILVVKTN